MYPPSCRASSDVSYASVFLKNSINSTVAYGYHFDTWTTGFIQVTNGTGLAAGKYYIEVTPYFTAKDVQDYTLTIYAPTAISILDSRGQTN